jgi:glycosyltransferase involved in cell wall biosynthesis
MPRFAEMLEVAYKKKGHVVELWSPKPWCYRLMPSGKLSKWAGYIDQFFLFPIVVKGRLRHCPRDTLFVFCDQALGPWVPLISQRAHVVHVHDLLALRSALGELPENPTALTGRIYQRYIRRGFRKARYFVSVSKKTREDLHRAGGVRPIISEVIYNGLNYPYAPMEKVVAEDAIRATGHAGLEQGFLLHIGSNQWYKNLAGVISIYVHYAQLESQPLPLLCVGAQPKGTIKNLPLSLPNGGRIVFINSLNARTLQAVYSLARALIFPSLEEGFGWPLIEAQACGCPVITTDAPPMNEVAGGSAVYIPRLHRESSIDTWAVHGASALRELLNEADMDKLRRRENGFIWANLFEPERAIDSYLRVYREVLARFENCHD